MAPGSSRGRWEEVLQVVTVKMQRHHMARRMRGESYSRVEVIEDASQEVALKFTEGRVCLPEDPEGGEPFCWVLLHHKIVDIERSNNSYNNMISRFFRAGLAMFDSPSLTKYIEIQAAFKDGLQTLPPKLWVVMLLHMEGLSDEEIAQVLGWPLSTVKTRLRKARDLLAAYLGLPPGWRDMNKHKLKEDHKPPPPPDSE